MPLEIERKFLLLNDHWRTAVSRSQAMAQGYLGASYDSADVADSGRSSVRVRIAGEQAHLNIKERRLGHSRLEFEYVIPLADARQLLQHCANHTVEKVRHWIPWHDLVFEVDEFCGHNQGLVVAELELPHPDHAFTRPDWLGAEVTDDQRYYNNELARHPWTTWARQEDA